MSKMSKLVIPLAILVSLLMVSSSFPEVFMKRDESLKLAFPNADTIEKERVYLSKQQASRIESLARCKLESRLYTFYVGKKGDETLGYALIDTHLLRTKSETVLFVINPDGTLRQAEILAFFEPQDYMASDSWIDLFSGKAIRDSLRVGRDIPNITGATITSNSLAESVRRVLAVYQVSLKENQLASRENR